MTFFSISSSSPLKSLPVFGLGLLMLSACVREIVHHGSFPRPDQIQSLQPQVDTQATVIEKLGSPSSRSIVGSAPDWFYISEITEKSILTRSKVDQAILELNFQGDLLLSYQIYSMEDGIKVPFSAKKTDYNSQSSSIWSQIFGNSSVGTQNIADL